jgi:5,10-methylenetetrahydromethanopterin reductase
MRVGLFLGDLLGLPADDVVAGIKGAAEEGFTSAWLPQVFGYEALTLLAIAGREIPGIELGTAVIPTYPRHPITLAGQALTVQSVTGGRLALGIGLSHQVVIEGMFGYSFDKPARHMREYLAALLPLLKGESVKFKGETLSATGQVGVPGATPPTVLLAAMAPVMLKLAGAVADGTITWMTGPKTVAGHIVPKMAEAAEKAGRDTPRTVVGLPVCVTDDPAGARERAAKTFAMYDTLPSYKNMLNAEGLGGPGDIAVVGPEDSVREQLAAVAEAGTTDLIASCFGRPDDKARTRALLAKL